MVILSYYYYYAHSPGFARETSCPKHFSAPVVTTHRRNLSGPAASMRLWPLQSSDLRTWPESVRCHLLACLDAHSLASLQAASLFLAPLATERPLGISTFILFRV